MTDALPQGIYELLRTDRLDTQLQDTELMPQFEDIPKGDSPHVLSRHIADAATRALEDIAEPEARRELANRVLSDLGAVDERLPALEQLLGLSSSHEPIPRPVTPLSEVALLTNARGEPNMASEVAHELASADTVELLCAFIRFAGISVLAPQLAQIRDRGVPLRVLTTTYRGATERRAVDELVTTYGARVRVRYETASTRLHAKAWLFRRASGFDTGYVGSSNLSRSALLDGLEWNVRISGVSTPALIRKFEATFDTYWNDPAFKDYDPTTDGELLDRALAEAGGAGSGRVTLTLSGLEVRPKPHQEAILEALDVERVVHDLHRNLVVAATGTGKTVVAALDYHRLSDAAGRRLPLLFVAHRNEILEQALRMYREVLSDANFGELYVDGLRPTAWKHVFASVQSLNAAALATLDATQFEVVVVDEFHHAEAATYRRLLEYLQPVELLGLTATPERSDGRNVLDWFGGRAAYELRLWDALDQDLLCPFHYFGIADNTDLRAVTWSRGSYDQAALSNVYTGNDARTRLVLQGIRDKVVDPTRMRALGFCVSVEHARYMARVFTDQGVRSLAVTGESTRTERAEAFAALRAGEVQCLFAVDLFNEGLDIPDVDTLLLLRPTQSATIFLQQLGRGLRRSAGKAVLTVLDFIGQQRREFRIDARYRALTGSSRKRLITEIEEGFPYLPGGSRLILDKVSQQIVTENVRASLRLNQRKEMVNDVRSHGIASLATYLRESGHELVDVYSGRGSWTALRRDAGLPTPPAGPDEDELLRRVAALTHVDDPERADIYRRLASVDGPSYNDLSEREQTLGRMLFFTLWPNRGGFDAYEDAFAHLRIHPAVCEEISQLLGVAMERIAHVPRTISPALASIPLLTHAHYRREEVLAATNWASMARAARGQAGGVIWAPDTKIDALFVNLHKDEGQFSPTTMYRDFPIARDLFHWESPNSTALSSGPGQRFLHHREMSTHVLLFVRDRPHNELGAAPFLLLSEVDYVEHRGERPIAITWRLRRPMPSEVLQSGAVVAE
ncbi:DUF3427 domain-containing protein [Rhodococcus sp. D2-41]|uniref:DUF3427 domain-containing protein n=1 Tax=Speluncibacter jeojiensis TaxID=2710754 RepID=UPI00240FFB4E|nr:DUF3427 domain-containing protein [Rhodococcus sp. D2-41]MDG3012619.1 DUF3427 domain-containing protein [Rhodococcus sp. D2-41]